MDELVGDYMGGDAAVTQLVAQYLKARGQEQRHSGAGSNSGTAAGTSAAASSSSASATTAQVETTWHGCTVPAEDGCTSCCKAALLLANYQASPAGELCHVTGHALLVSTRSPLAICHCAEPRCVGLQSQGFARTGAQQLRDMRAPEEQEVSF